MQKDDDKKEFEVEELEDDLEDVAGGACHCAGACQSGDCSGCCKEVQQM